MKILTPKNTPNQPPGAAFQQPSQPNKGCILLGIGLKHNHYLANLGSILVAGLAILVTFGLLWRTNRKAAAVGRREIQMFLLGYMVIEVCEIFSCGGFPIDNDVRKGFSCLHIAAIVATLWVLLLNALVGFQLLDDGTAVSMLLIGGSAAAIFVGTGYIALDTAFSWTGFWDSSHGGAHSHKALYTLYQVVPLVFLFLFFVFESILVLRVLGEAEANDLFSGSGTAICHWPNIQLYCLGTHLYRIQSANQWSLLRDIIYAAQRRRHLGVLVQHNRRRLADTARMIVWDFARA